MAIFNHEDLSVFDAAWRRDIERLLLSSLTPVTGHVDPDARTVTVLYGAFPLERQGDLVTDIRGFVDPWARVLGLPRGLAGLGAPQTVTREDRTARVILRQLRGQIPVYRAGVEVEVGQDGNVRSVTTRLADAGEGSAPPQRTAKEAAEEAGSRIAGERPFDPHRLLDAELVVVDPSFLFGDSREPWLAWRLVVPGEDGPVDVLVNDASGDVDSQPVRQL